MRDPPLQNIPIHTDLSRRLREAFKEDGRDLPEIDYGELEKRVFASMTEEERAEWLKLLKK